MTDEERRELCFTLRHLPRAWDDIGCEAAAEMERLAKELDKAQRACGAMLQSQHPLEGKLLLAEREIERLAERLQERQTRD